MVVDVVVVVVDVVVVVVVIVVVVIVVVVVLIVVVVVLIVVGGVQVVGTSMLCDAVYGGHDHCPRRCPGWFPFLARRVQMRTKGDMHGISLP